MVSVFCLFLILCRFGFEIPGTGKIASLDSIVADNDYYADIMGRFCVAVVFAHLESNSDLWGLAKEDDVYFI